MKEQISLTCDAWQASNADTYFAVTGHWIEERVQGLGRSRVRCWVSQGSTMHTMVKDWVVLSLRLLNGLELHIKYFK